MGLSNERIVVNLSIDPSTVRRTVKLFSDTGSVSKKYDNSCLTCKLTDVVQFFILQLVLQLPRNTAAGNKRIPPKVQQRQAKP